MVCDIHCIYLLQTIPQTDADILDKLALVASEVFSKTICNLSKLGMDSYSLERLVVVCIMSGDYYMR